jgi:superfamily I DNA and/or RNA helicase
MNNEKEGKDIISDDRIILKNGYLPNNLLQILNQQIGLCLNKYVFTFCINKAVISKYNPENSNDILPNINDDGCSFSFHTTIKQSNTKEDLYGDFDEQNDFGFKFTRLKRTFDRKFGAENVSFESQFEYSYDKDLFINHFLPNQSNWEESFWNVLQQSFQGQGISISSDNENIGVDFNWEEETLKDVLTRVASLCPYITLSYYDNHRCNKGLNYQNTLLKEIEDKMRISFPSIQFDKDIKDGTLYFFQEYNDQSKCNQIIRSLNDELSQICSSDLSYEIFPISTDREKYYLSIDTDSYQEDLTEKIRDLRGCDFFLEEISIGKLIRVNFPQLIFDISSSDKNKITSYVNEHLINKITPNLTGDLEKIARLKKSFDAISSGNGVLNANLPYFIFDSTKANPIDDIDCYLTPQSDIYNDINYNLLNNKINESQKQAIIKTLLTEDLAIIQGPPGTGKSTAIAEIIWQHIRKNPKERILLTSETNLAVDNAIARIVNTTHNIVKPIRIGDEDKLEIEGKQFNLDTLEKWVENGSLIFIEIENNENIFGDDENELYSQQEIILENWLTNISRRINTNQMDNHIYSLWKNLLMQPSKHIRQAVFDCYIRNCNVVGATCSSIGEKNTKNSPTNFFRKYCELFGKVENKTNKDGKTFRIYKGKFIFDTVIQDESSKATPAELSLPLVYGKKNIIIGDHRQLPPLLDKEEFLSSLTFLLNKIEDEQQIKKIKKLQNFVQKHFNEMEISHFQRLFESIDDSLKSVFNLQYRMHPAINEVIKQFYVEDGGLSCGLDNNEIEDPNVSNPQSRFHGLNINGFISPNDHVIWIDTKTPEMLVGTSRVNYGEVETIKKILTKFQNSESFKIYQSLWDNNEDKQIGLISFYGKQIKLLRELRTNFNEIPIRISTVDRFQGMERNIIIVSMVRSNIIATNKNQQADYELYPELGFAPQNNLLHFIPT